MGGSVPPKNMEVAVVPLIFFKKNILSLLIFKDSDLLELLPPKR